MCCGIRRCLRSLKSTTNTVSNNTSDRASDSSHGSETNSHIGKLTNRLVLRYPLRYVKAALLGKMNLFRTIYVASDIWQSIGWNSIIFIAALSGVVFFHERLSAWVLLGIACVLGGVALLAKDSSI